MVTDAGTEPSSPLPPPPTPPSGGRSGRKLVRYPDRGPIGGVCEGIAEYLDLDPTVVRFGAIVAACIGPGLPAYVLAWIFMPEADGTTLASHSRHRHHGHRGNRFSQMAGIVLIGIAVSVLWGDWWSPARGWILPVTLIAFGGWLVVRPRDDDDDDDLLLPPATSVAPAPPVPPAGATEADFSTGTGGSTSTEATAEHDALDSDDTLIASTSEGGSAGGAVPPTSTASQWAGWGHGYVPTRRRRSRVLGPLVFGALLVWGGIAWLAGVDVKDGLAIGLCILGAGFVIGAFVGGSRGLVFPALLIAAALIAVSVIDIPLDGGIGDRTWRIDSIRDLDDDYELAIGEAILDLRDLRPASGRVPKVDMSVGIGHLRVVVPEGSTVEIEAQVGAGEINVLGHRDDGMGVEFNRTVRGDSDGDHFVFDLQVGLGELEVVEAAR